MPFFNPQFYFVIWAPFMLLHCCICVFRLCFEIFCLQPNLFVAWESLPTFVINLLSFNFYVSSTSLKVTKGYLLIKCRTNLVVVAILAASETRIYFCC